MGDLVIDGTKTKQVRKGEQRFLQRGARRTEEGTRHGALPGSAVSSLCFFTVRVETDCWLN